MTPPLSTTRRGFLLHGLTSAAIATTQSGAAAAPRAHRHGGDARSEKRLVVIYLEGGNDGLNTVIPTHLARYYDRRPTIAIPENEALSLNSGPAASRRFKLHPALTEIHRLWNEGDVAALHKVGYPDPNLSHFLSLDVWGRGARKPASSGWLARLQDAYAKDRFAVVGLGTRSQLDFRGSKNPSLLIESLNRFRANGMSKGDARGRVQQDVVESVLREFGTPGTKSLVSRASMLGFETVEVLQEAVRKYRSKEKYEATGISDRLRDAAILIQNGLSTNVIYTKDGGYDTHAAQGGVTGRHAQLLSRVDRAIGSFARDLKSMGVWKDTVIAVVSEFGRRNAENGSRGTDHGTANTALVIGGGVRGGLYGTELNANDLGAKFPGYEIDFRSLYSEIISEHLGCDPKPVFPERRAKAVKLGFVL